MTNLNGEKLSMQEVKETIKEYILGEFLPGENPAELTDSTPLTIAYIIDFTPSLGRSGKSNLLERSQNRV